MHACLALALCKEYWKLVWTLEVSPFVALPCSPRIEAGLRYVSHIRESQVLTLFVIIIQHTADLRSMTRSFLKRRSIKCVAFRDKLIVRNKLLLLSKFAIKVLFLRNFFSVAVVNYCDRFRIASRQASLRIFCWCTFVTNTVTQTFKLTREGVRWSLKIYYTVCRDSTTKNATYVSFD